MVDSAMLEIHRLVVVPSGRRPARTSFAYVILNCRVACLFRRQLQLVVAEYEEHIVAACLESRADDVHLRRADKLCDEQVGRHVIEVLGRVNLLDKSVFP